MGSGAPHLRHGDESGIVRWLGVRNPFSGSTLEVDREHGVAMVALGVRSPVP